MFSFRSRNLQCQRIFQVNAPINCVCLHPNQVRFVLHICVNKIKLKAVMELLDCYIRIYLMWAFFFCRLNCLLETKVVWSTSGILKQTTMNSSSQSQRCRSTQCTLTPMLATWLQSIALLVSTFHFLCHDCSFLAYIHSSYVLNTTKNFLFVLIFAVAAQGNCYVWNLAGGIGDEVTQLIPKTKIPAHKRYSLRCKFSPDST